MKTFLLVRPLLWMNRWLLLLLLLWPYAMATLLLIGGLNSAPEDVLSVLKQECMYGIALVGFNGAALLANEQRSRRIVTVLARAVSRAEYLLALLLAAWVPLALYVVGFAVSACLLVRLAGAPLDVVWRLVLLLLVAGLWVASLSICFSVFLPSILGSLASLGITSVLAYFSVGGPGRVTACMMRMPLTLTPPLDAVDILLTLAASAAVFAAASVVFARRDLNLSTD